MNELAGRSPVIVAAKRTAIGNSGHGFAEVPVEQLAAPVLGAVAGEIESLGIAIDDVILGNCLGPGGDIARVSSLQAGLGVEVPGVTVDRQCGSGLDAVAQAASRIRSGDDRLILAGGVESASTSPWRFWPPTGGESPVRYTRAPFAPKGFDDPDMGVAADDLARIRGIGRERQDLYAARSFARASAHDFSAEIVPIAGVRTDERIRPGMTAARLGRLRPTFTTDGTVTAGNSCGISDGAAALAVTSAAYAAGMPALRIVGSAVAGSDPALPGLGPVAAIEKLLLRTGVTLGDVGIVEITEAFASVVLAVVDALGIDEDRICPGGGAIAMGHPWGASGAILLVRLASSMLGSSGSVYGPELGLAACAIGGGQGIAMLVERVA